MKGVTNVYKKFVLLLEKLNITTYRVSKETGIGQNVFSNWKSGRNNPSLKTLHILSNYFKVPIEYFLED